MYNKQTNKNQYLNKNARTYAKKALDHLFRRDSKELSTLGLQDMLEEDFCKLIEQAYIRGYCARSFKGNNKNFNNGNKHYENKSRASEHSLRTEQTN